MKNKTVKTLLAATMSVAMVTGNAAPAVQAQGMDETGVKAAAGAQIVPTPKEMSTDGQELTMTESVNIEGADAVDKDAVRELKEFLTDKGIEVNETADDQDTTIILGEADDEIAALDKAKERLGMEDADALGEEGYVMAVDSEDSNAGTIAIEGKSGDGTFYGVQTLKQLAEESDGNVVVADAVIKDEPTMSVRGTIEGFYGNPWSHADGLRQIEFYGDMKMNTYIYAPKDDP